ncbi:MAG TPA: EcsC family protein [Dermatophilaceae bacterium]
MGIFGKDVGPAHDTTDPAVVGDRATAGSSAGAATRIIERLMDVGIDGKAPFDSARKVANVAIAGHSGAELSIDALIRSHLRLAAAGGFVTSLGGFVTLPIALPANVFGFYVVATRLVAGIAAIRGYDLTKPEVRSAVLLALVGADADDLLKKAGYVSTGPLANLAIQRLPGPALMAVNKGIGFRLLTQVGKKSLTRFGKALPLVGGVVGAGVDTFLLRRIADHARREFPPRSRTTS